MSSETILFPSGGPAYRPPPQAPPPAGRPAGTPATGTGTGGSTGTGTGLARPLLIFAACAVAFVFVIVIVAGLAFRYALPADPTDALTLATREYVRTLPDAYERAAEDVRSGKIRTKAELVGELASHARPLSSAMDDAFTGLVDDKGQITDREKAFDVLDRVYRGLKGGRR